MDSLALVMALIRFQRTLGLGTSLVWLSSVQPQKAQPPEPRMVVAQAKFAEKPGARSPHLAGVDFLEEALNW